MPEHDTHHHMVDIFQATLAGSLLGAGVGFAFFTGSLNMRSDLSLLVRETALCSTICGATAGISAIIHNRSSEHRKEERVLADQRHQIEAVRQR